MWSTAERQKNIYYIYRFGGLGSKEEREAEVDMEKAG